MISAEASKLESTHRLQELSSPTLAMSKKSFKSQASSSRAVSGAFGQPEAASNISNFGVTSTFGPVPSSSLSYVYEPPDLSSISEPSVVVALKNLQKKDSTTKSKALEELQVYVLSLAVQSGGVEEAILEPWVRIFQGNPFW